MARVFQPTILQTKQELLLALKSGEIKSSKYNLLSDAEKTFVELMVFGDYTGDQAIRVMDPTQKHPGVVANKMLGNPDVADTIDELTVQKDKKFMSEVSSARDMALAKLKYIMTTTKDDTLAAATAKTIMDKAEKVLTKKEQDTGPGHVQFNIQVENLYAQGDKRNDTDDIVIPLEDADFEEIENEKAVKREELIQIDKKIDQRKKDLKDKRKENKSRPINPKTGLPYTLTYEAVNLYEKEKEED